MEATCLNVDKMLDLGFKVIDEAATIADRPGQDNRVLHDYEK